MLLFKNDLLIDDACKFMLRKLKNEVLDVLFDLVHLKWLVTHFYQPNDVFMGRNLLQQNSFSQKLLGSAGR